MNVLENFVKVTKEDIADETNRQIHRAAALILGCDINQLWICTPDTMDSFEAYYTLRRDRFIVPTRLKQEYDGLETVEQMVDGENNRYVEFNSRGFCFMFTFED